MNKINYFRQTTRLTKTPGLISNQKGFKPFNVPQNDIGDYFKPHYRPSNRMRESEEGNE